MEEFTNHSMDHNGALSFSAPLYLYYTKPTPLSDSTNVEFKEFEFDQSCRDTVHPSELTDMSFADELFNTGVLLPLKPPPRLQNVNYRSKSGSSTPNMRSILKNPFARLSPSKHKADFDPFVVALEKIRKKDDVVSTRTRARSLSPMRNLNWVRKTEEKLIGTNIDSVINAETSAKDRKLMLKGKKRFVLKEMRKPFVSYKHSFFMCFGFGF